MSNVFTSDRLGTCVPRAAEPYSNSDTSRGPRARLTASPSVSMVSCAAMQGNVHAVAENQQDRDPGQGLALRGRPHQRTLGSWSYAEVRHAAFPSSPAPPRASSPRPGLHDISAV